jgi:hypothetical protein
MSVLDRGGWSMPHPGHTAPRKKTRYPLYRRLGGSQGQFGQVRELSLPLGFNSCTIHPSNLLCQLPCIGPQFIITIDYYTVQKYWMRQYILMEAVSIIPIFY